MSTTLYHRLIVSPGKAQQEILNFLIHEVFLQPTNIQKK
jgi:hypothetical protein